MSQGSFTVGTTAVTFLSVDLPEIPKLTSNVWNQHTPGQNGANSVDVDDLTTSFSISAIVTGTWTESSDKADTVLDSIRKRIGTLLLHKSTSSQIRLDGLSVASERKTGGASTAIEHQVLNISFTRMA